MAVVINEQVLAKAVEAKIRPLLINQGYLDDSRYESYHHHKVMPAAQRLLARSSLEKDTRAAMIGTITASLNLLSQYEKMQAIDFLKQHPRADVRDNVLDLLYGEEMLANRIAAFLKWGAVRTISGGKKVGMNATVVSYLLAMSDPAVHAFCKPEIYWAAAVALLGKDQVEDDPIQRLLHCTEFYRAALESFRTQYHLDQFTDLMYCHIAFYVMVRYKDIPPTWDTLAQWKPAVPTTTTPEEIPMQPKSHALNLILYGPPGVGKTYQTISKAVAICNGTAPEDRRRVLARFNSLREQGRVHFVTFHQSYGYEEFVEGIRPVLVDGDGESDSDSGRDVRYECRSGVFKRICQLARAGTTSAQRGIEVDLDKHSVWKMSLGDTTKPEEAGVYEECVRDSQIRLGYGMHQDFSACDDRETVLAKLRQVDAHIAPEDYNVVSVDRFKNRMRNGDLVIVSDGNRKFRAIGRVTGDYRHIDADDYDQARPVEWLLVLKESLGVEAISARQFSQQSIHQLREHVLKTDALRQLLSGKPLAAPQPFVLIVDEINRGNISKIFGELITLIEPDKRLGSANELRVTLPYSEESFGVPGNVYLLGTMNTADRSIAFLDTALRRRFRFQEMMPDTDVIRRHVGTKGVVDGIDVGALLETINRRIELLYDRDHQIGHSYFMGVRSLADLYDVFQDQIIPLLQEYFHDDWAQICHVLACPYDAESGELLSENPLPFIVATRLNGELLEENAPPDLEPRLRYAINPGLVVANGQLSDCFRALLNGSVKPAKAGTEN